MIIEYFANLCEKGYDTILGYYKEDEDMKKSKEGKAVYEEILLNDENINYCIKRALEIFN